MAVFLHRPLPIRPSVFTTRAFSTTIPTLTSLQLEHNDPELLADTVPAYPHGPARWFKQSNRGLYGGQIIQFGNNVGPKSKTKTRRSWHPNVFRRRLYSKALDRLVQIRVSTRVLRTIDKVGGLDEYLLGEKEARIRELGVSGWWLRWAIMQTPEVRRRFREQRVGFGVPENGLPDEEVATEEGEAQVQGTLDEGGKMRRLKFRVGPRAHLYYSGGRWRRAKPDKGRRFKDILRKSDRTYIEYRDELRRTTLENLEEVLRKLPKKQRLSETEQNTLRQKAMREVDKRAEKLVQNRWQAKALRDSRMNRKKLRKFLRKKRRMMTRAELRDARRRDSREKTGEALMKDAGVESGRMRDERE